RLKTCNLLLQFTKHINGYLLPAPDVYLRRINRSLYGMPRMTNGNRAYDGNNLVMTAEEKDELIHHDPIVAKWIHPYYMGADLVNNKPRYVLWLNGVEIDEFSDVPSVMNRVEAVRVMRESSKNQSTRKAAKVPHLFQTITQPNQRYLAFPRVSSSRRDYLPIAFLDPTVICGDKLIIVPEGDIYVFSILSSKAHKLWTWVFAGRLKSDISYSSSVYNNYPWPEPTHEQKVAIERSGQAIINARNNHPGESLASLYDPDRMPADLLDAHKALDAAVEAAYGLDSKGDDNIVVAHLFKLYEKTIQKERRRNPLKKEQEALKHDNQPLKATVKIKVKVKSDEAN
ncbi:MAG: hypothetical protein IJ133_07330, partial [Clostridia bacterium]|nr:hypothetical protein [Clostridia bacterium]